MVPGTFSEGASWPGTVPSLISAFTGLLCLSHGKWLNGRVEPSVLVARGPILGFADMSAA